MKNKTIVGLILISLVINYNWKGKQKVKKARIRIKKAKLGTPKGYGLDNIFGQDSQQNVYGPRPELINREAFIENKDGSISKRRIRLIRRMGNLQTSNCDIMQKQNYYVCMNLNNCDLCTASEHCGWCEQMGMCLPGNIKESTCPGTCINGWSFENQSCDNIVKSGYLGNFDPTGTETFKSVEYTKPKYKVDTVVHSNEVVSTPVLLGNIKEIHSKTYVDSSKDHNNNVVTGQNITITKPVFGELRRVMDVKTHNIQYLDQSSGKRVDVFGPENVKFHGTNEYNIPNEEGDHTPYRSVWYMDKKKKKK